MSCNNHLDQLKEMLTSSRGGSSQLQAGAPSNEAINQQQQQQQQQQQEALASLFRSLSSLANGANQPPTQPTQGPQATNLNNYPVGLMNLTTRDAGAPPVTQAVNPFQSVVAAAAAVQQQLATMNQNPAPATTSHHAASNLQPTGGAPFFTGPVDATGYSPFLGHTQGQPLGPDQEMQFNQTECNTLQQQQQQQRINYCTICNKELCNKYFMKTHMLKMHGINLEVEQSGSEDEVGQPRTSDSANRDNEGQQSPECSSNSSGWPSKQGTQSVNKNLADSKQSVSSSDTSQQQQQQQQANKSKVTNASGSSKPATSVMNGFAGNSMGGVVCDICNKELCSKYFLKVHKQNTHGIMTDYQDASQFVYPFSSPMPNPFLPPQIPMSVPTSNVLPFQTSPCFTQSGGPCKPSTSEYKSKANGSKKARLMADSKQQSRDCKPFETNLALDGQQLDPIYRLMMNQQMGGQSPMVPGPPFDPIAANQMNALMCFGAMGPFGPASLSPTMVVEIILRNQHLINRNNLSGPMTTTMTGKSGKDKNNNDSKQTKGSAAKGSKEASANNSRYFTHYTEACPMCDRRFKSIKWLKTHMMNDHKQEIGTYMQMMMQSLYPTKSQPTTPVISQTYDQVSSYPTSINFSQCNQLIAQLQQQQQQLPPPPKPQLQQHVQKIQQISQTPPTSYNDTQHQPTSIMHSEQYNIVQNYLNQQRQIFQQQQQQPKQTPPTTLAHLDTKNFSPTESSHQPGKLLTLADVQNHGRETSSSSDKTSPRSVVTGSECEDDHQQLDLSMKFNLGSRQEEGVGTNYSLQKPGSILNDDDDYSNDENSTRSSSNQGEEDQGIAIKEKETNDLSNIVQVKTTSDA